MSEQIKSALTPDEWERHFFWRDKHAVDATNSGPFNIRWNAGGGTPGRHFQEFAPSERHALAALALHGQPFGFTQVDVDQLRLLAMVTGGSERAQRAAEWMESLADRIAALLPPESR